MAQVDSYQESKSLVETGLVHELYVSTHVETKLARGTPSRQYRTDCTVRITT